MHTRFEEVTLSVSRAGKCPVCGRRSSRSKTFFQTVNPFNRRKNGQVKTREQVAKSVRKEAEKWAPPFRHDACRKIMP